MCVKDFHIQLHLTIQGLLLLHSIRCLFMFSINHDKNMTILGADYVSEDLDYDALLGPRKYHTLDGHRHPMYPMRSSKFPNFCIVLNIPRLLQIMLTLSICIIGF